MHLRMDITENIFLRRIRHGDNIFVLQQGAAETAVTPIFSSGSSIQMGERASRVTS